ncbi:MAG: secretin and TonB N-terminal domain-containing protein [Desulfobulbaceae bacterium]|nr:secretin and TonB N-terminal domain-containing protein [Desulfobulbaceae bacterium]
MLNSTLEIQINGSGEPAYTAYELFQPQRIIIDIAGTAAEQQNLQVPDNIPVSLAVSEITDSQQPLTRFEFTPDAEYSDYSVTSLNNNIVLTVSLAEDTASGEDAEEMAAGDEIGSLITREKDIESQLPEMKLPTGETLTAQVKRKKDEKSSLKDSFSFGGYERTRITVDFYKIDLHNVFRLFREVSDLNIVVDESVSGSLTLALNDVPWDFALDIILNLKNLQKEERYNTIVIMPQKKEFSWPKRVEDNLTFKADEKAVAKEAIIIQQQQNITPEAIEAKQLVQKGSELEKKGDFETAIQAYVEAWEKWPENDLLAIKISSLYLVYLRQNAKAVYYAKKALEINNNSKAALNAAIAHANMQQYQEAQQYFNQSVSDEKPSKEALLSYAVFSESQNEYQGALTLLDKLTGIYGENLDSMIAYARILDKQGEHEAATEKYKKIMLSGFRVPSDLQKYIKDRIAFNQSM